MASCLHSERRFSPKPLLTAAVNSQFNFQRLDTLRRQASTRANPLGYKPAPPSSNKNATAPPTGFAAIGGYNTIARRWTAIMVGIPVIVVTSYALYGRLVLGQEQKPLSALPQGPLNAKDV